MVPYNLRGPSDYSDVTVELFPDRGDVLLTDTNDAERVELTSSMIQELIPLLDIYTSSLTGAVDEPSAGYPFRYEVRCKTTGEVRAGFHNDWEARAYVNRYYPATAVMVDTVTECVCP